MGANLLGYAIAATDTVVVGHLLGAHPLGLYTLGSNVSAWPLQFFVPLLANVGLPLISRYQGDPEGRRAAVRRIAQLAGLSGCALSGLLVGLATPLVAFLYGDKWAEAAPILAVLAVYGAVRIPLALYADVLVAAGAAWALFRLQGAWLAVLIPAVILCTRVGGPVGAAVAVVVSASAVALPLSLLYVRRAFALRASTTLRPFLLPLVAGSCAAIMAKLAGSMTSQPWGSMVIGGLVGLVVFALVANVPLRDSWFWLKRHRASASGVEATQ